MKRLQSGILLALLSVLSQSTSAQQRSPDFTPDATSAAQTFTLLNINNISIWVRNDGWSARNPYTGNAGLIFPRGTTAAIVFQDGVLWGFRTNRVSQQIRIGGQYYLIGTQPGRIISPGVAEPQLTTRIYRIRNDYRIADLRADAAELRGISLQQVTQTMIDSVRAQYESDWSEWPWQQGAPFYDVNGNGIKEANEEPGLAGANQVIWFAANDLVISQFPFYGCSPVGLEMQATLWAYSNDSTLQNVFFKRLRLVYKGKGGSFDPDSSLTNMYFFPWADPDLGNAGDDFVGCDTTLNLGFVYNGQRTDSEYARFGLPPPAFGYVLLQGPRVSTGNLQDTAIFNMKKIAGTKNLRMTAFSYFASGDAYSHPEQSYTGAQRWYQMMRGLPPSPLGPNTVPRLDFVTRQPTYFWLSGDPVTRSGWFDGLVDYPGDRYLQMSSGPFTMALGDTQEIVLAGIAAWGADNINSVTRLRAYTQAAVDTYDELVSNVPPPIAPPPPPPTPQTYQLAQNYPNPFNGETTISFTIPDYQVVSLKVYDLVGRDVATLREGITPAGRNFVNWNANGFSSGVYYYRLRVGSFGSTRKLIILR